MATVSSILAWRILMGASLIAQLVKNPPAMQESLVQFVDQEDPLEEGMASPSSILARRMSMDGGTSKVLSDSYSLK